MLGTPVRFKRITHLYAMTSMSITQRFVLIKQVSFNNNKEVFCVKLNRLVGAYCQIVSEQIVQLLIIDCVLT